MILVTGAVTAKLDNIAKMTRVSFERASCVICHSNAPPGRATYIC